MRTDDSVLSDFRKGNGSDGTVDPWLVPCRYRRFGKAAADDKRTGFSDEEPDRYRYNGHCRKRTFRKPGLCGQRAGLVKGYATEPDIELPPREDGKLDVGGYVGRRGKLTIIRDLGLKEPYVGMCNLVSGEIAEDFAQYFTASEQQPSLVYLGVREEAESGKVIGAGGILIQPMPGCPEEQIARVEAAAQQFPNLDVYL